MTVWQVRDDELDPLPKRRLDKEGRLERWVAADPNLLGLDVHIIGRQVNTAYGGRIDLLGIDQEGDLAVIELKRDKTPRDIVAQVLDYASWIDGLGHDEIDQITQSYLGMSLGKAYADHFKTPLPDAVNGSHQMVIVAAELDDASERIAQYLVSRHGLNINVVFFNVFEHDGQELLARSWLMDPEAVIKPLVREKRPPWTGSWYVNHGRDRSWDDRRKFGYVTACGGEQYSRPLRRLRIGDRLFVYIKGHGYVGYGEVTQERTLAAEFVPEDQSRALPELDLETPIKPDPPRDGNEEYAVGVRWLDSVPRGEAKTFAGAFANPHIVCKLRDPATLEFLRREFNTAKPGDGDS